MYNSKYYTCEQIDQRLLEGYYDDAVAAGYTGSKAQYLAGLLKAINYVANPTITAANVVYNPAISGLTHKNVQGAIDELANKKANSEDVDSKIQTEQERVNAELDKKFDKESVVQEFGDSEDKVVSQFALPFRAIESPEFIKAIVDAEDHFLFGIQLDGSIEWGKGIPAPIRTNLQEIINQCQKDKTDILEAINAAKEELSASITALQEGKVDKEEGKSLIEDEVKECFRIIENEEFIKAIVDSDDKVLFGFYRATGKPYYPLNEMYHVEQNEEFFAVWLDADDKILLGIRRDGQIIGEIHAVNALKQVISQLQLDVAALQEKVGTIDTNLKELLDVFSLLDNEEYLAVEQDAEGKVLSATHPDGSHYIHNVKSETIPTEFSHIEDPERRSEITTDSEGKVISYRDSEGVKHENVGIETPHIKLTEEGLDDLGKALKAKGYGNIMDWSDKEYVELPIPDVCAIVNFGIDSQATSKSGRPDFEPGVNGEIPTYMEYWDKNGNYFKKPILLSAQGSSSMSMPIKNQAFDLDDGSKLKFGTWVAQDSFHIKKYYIDIFRGQCVVGYWLTEQMYQTFPYGERRPWDYLNANNSLYEGLGEVKKDFDTGALAHPDGFPILVYFNGKCNGVYTFSLKKHRDNYYQNKKNTNHIILDGALGGAQIWGSINAAGVVDWREFEIRNPKPKKKSDGWDLLDINGNKYNGDNPTEIMGTDSPNYDPSDQSCVKTAAVKNNILRIANALSIINANPSKELYEQYFNAKFVIEYYLVSNVLLHFDGFVKNWIWCVWDGNIWTPTSYDMDSIFGMHWQGCYVLSAKWILGGSETDPTYFMSKNNLYWEDVKTRYAELRGNKVFSVENIIGLLEKWLDSCGYDNIKNEVELYATETPSYRADLTDTEYWKFLGHSGQYSAGYATDYDPTKADYAEGDKVIYYGYIYEALGTMAAGTVPSQLYNEYPQVGGFYNSIQRVKNWLVDRFSILDAYFEYNS